MRRVDITRSTRARVCVCKTRSLQRISDLGVREFPTRVKLKRFGDKEYHIVSSIVVPHKRVCSDYGYTSERLRVRLYK